MALLASELIKLNNLQLAGKLVSDELMLGIHASKRSGSGTEFEQYRHYEPGDDPKRIDWKLYARTNKHLVRESATESNLHIRFLLDLSGSMNYEEEGISRLHYAKLIMASLAYLGYRQSDQMSLYTLHQGDLQTLVPVGKQSFQKILYALENAQASGPWLHANPAFPDFQQKQKELLVMVSDFLQVGDEWLQLIQHIAGPRREIVIFQLLGEQELDFRLSGFYRFHDLETGREVELQAEAVRASYQQAATEYLSKLDESLHLPHVHLIRVRLTDPVALVLKDFLTRRQF
ncbi:DUF58 domain-containing protein [Telluribacter sp. SYSU D00476]|uniref:DUF58 domain-containing protein n=1 Tax=Telluribacter sp. SYSU D00476 TaxID=2811430 RepID=UPI001FF6832B|nr:DUF58 domain-containing protein [Telluribacter sp. SYSU D00476]